MENKINIVLSGGAIKGIAHLALIEKIQSFCISINSISGSSSGALVAALFSSGLSPSEIINFFERTPLFRFSFIAAGKAGFFDSMKYAKLLRNVLPNTFEELAIPITICATNLNECKAEYFDTGPLLTPLAASCAMPPLFSPVLFNENIMVDGGVLDNFPISKFQGSDLPLIGSYVCMPGKKDCVELNSTIKIANHASTLLVHGANAQKIKETDYTVIFPLQEFGSFNPKDVRLIYNRATEYLDSIESKLYKALNLIMEDSLSNI